MNAFESQNSPTLAWLVAEQLVALGYSIEFHLHPLLNKKQMSYVEMRAQKNSDSYSMRIEIDQQFCLDGLTIFETAAYCCAIELMASIERNSRMAA